MTIGVACQISKTAGCRETRNQNGVPQARHARKVTITIELLIEATFFALDSDFDTILSILFIYVEKVAQEAK